MRDRCRATPQNSEELIAMIQYMEEARCQGMVRMEEKISVGSYTNVYIYIYCFLSIGKK